MAFVKTNKENVTDDFKYEVEEDLGVFFTEGKKEWKLQRISFNGREPKYDIRPWDSETGRMGKGVSMNGDVLEALYEKLKEVAEG